MRVAPRRVARKSVACLGFHADRAIRPWRTALTRGLTVFIFHEITASPSQHQRAGRSYTRPATFEQQLDWIARRWTVIAPSCLPQLGGEELLPTQAALITFDDAWAGVFRTAIPILRKRGLPATCFLNMGTVNGDPDLVAVRRYETTHPPAGGRLLIGGLDLAAGERALEEIRDRYGDDPDFRAFQGETATPDDLERVAGDDVWFGSHLYHHWALPDIAMDLYEASFRRNAEALRAYPRALPAYATPHGFAGDEAVDVVAVPMNNGARVVFIGQGKQNRLADAPVLDRVWFPPEPSNERDWWYAAHRKRVLGGWAS